MDIESRRHRQDSISNAWNHCLYCENVGFKTLQDFIRHLRSKHCSVEGGSFVCTYGYNSVCNSLPIDGVSDADYVDHIHKHHAFLQLSLSSSSGSERKLSSSSQKSNLSDQNSNWTTYSANQNLAAVLNDPNKGKQKDFFTKLWGMDFTEKTSADIPKHPYLPEINLIHFENYLRKISKRHKRHLKMNEDVKMGQTTKNDIFQMFPKLKIQHTLLTSKNLPKNYEIPSIFLQPDFDISKPTVFYDVFYFAKNDSPGNNSFQQNGKLLQEKLTHDLDKVEVLIAEQIAQKSDAFFQAMTSHDSLMDQLASTLSVVKSLRHEISVIDNTWVKKSLRILQLKRQKQNSLYVLQKIKLMNTLHQTQPTIQTLLSTPDYVGALELIATTQELLTEELQGVHSFRHLSSQLNEINRLIDKMMNNEFENYSVKDLNQPLNNDVPVIEVDKLKSILLGMLKRKCTLFISKYKQEAFTTIKTIVKQTVLEALAENDCDADGPYSVDQAQILDLNRWIDLFHKVTKSLVKLLQRIKVVQGIMKETVYLSMGQQPSSPTIDYLDNLDELTSNKSSLEKPVNKEVAISDFNQAELNSEISFLSKSECAKILVELRELLVSVCDFSHDECAKLLTALAKNRTAKEKNIKGSDKVTINGSVSVFDNVSAKQIYRLSKIIEDFIFECEKISSKSPTSLKGAFQYQANKFMNKFHNERKEKLILLLEKETWTPAEVEPVFQNFIDDIVNTQMISKTIFEVTETKKSEFYLLINNEKYVIVGVAQFLIQMVKEYSNMAEDLSLLAFNILRNLAELLFLFNSRSCQLVLGAGALQTAKLRTITSTNLVLTSRSLQVIVLLIPYISKHFSDILCRANPVNFIGSNSSKNSGLNDLNEVKKNMKDHINKLHNKVVVIVSSVIANEIINWGAKPPVPSLCFRQISKHLTKLHEAVAGILPPNQIEELYRNIHNSFKSALKEQLKKLNIVNNGGPHHGIVTSELIFYIEMLKKLQIFSSEELTENSLEDIWI